MTHPSVHLQIASEDQPSVPNWFGEVAIVAQVFITSGILKNIEEQVHVARARFATYERVDFVAVLIGYAVSTEPTLRAFYERLLPFASARMALFGRKSLPHRSTLSRYLAALDQPTIEAFRSLFLDDLILRTAQTFPPGGLWDRQSHHWQVIDVDGTKQAARQRALPELPELPAPHRRFEQVCAPGYLGRKRGEVARTRTTVLQAHSHHWLGTFGGPGNGDYRGELARALDAIISYAGWLCMPLSQIMIRLDGLYGNGGVLKNLVQSGVGITGRSKDYGFLDLPTVQTRLQSPPDQQCTHPESGASRSLFDCPEVPLTPTGPCVRLIVATHPATSTSKPPIGVLRAETVYELFLSTANPSAFTCADVLDLYLHRGSFETVLADEDQEQGTDRWCSHTACGQEFWQIVNQWLWNLRLDLGHHLSPSAMRLTEFAPAAEIPSVESLEPIPVPLSGASHEAPPVPPSEPMQYGPPQWARSSFTKGFAGSDFVPQPDGSLRCPASHLLSVHEHRPERNGSVRVIYGARIAHCRPCPLRQQCQESTTTKKPRQVSAVLWPIKTSTSVPVQPPAEPLVPPQARHPVLWGDWPRSRLRRQWLHTLHTQTVELTFRSLPSEEVPSTHRNDGQTRAQRACYRLSWQQRLARNACPASSPPLEITIYGLSASLAQYVRCDFVIAA
jgi:hypothetical protein